MSELQGRTKIGWRWGFLVAGAALVAMFGYGSRPLAVEREAEAAITVERVDLGLDFLEMAGLTSPQAASALGISAINARVRLHRARSALRDEVQRLIGCETQSLYSFHLDRCDRVVEAVLSRLLKED